MFFYRSGCQGNCGGRCGLCHFAIELRVREQKARKRKQSARERKEFEKR